MGRDLRGACVALACVDVLSAGLIANRVAGRPGFLALHGAELLLFGCLGALAVYAVAALAVARWKGASGQREMRIAAWAGTAAAVWMSIQLAVERFITLPSDFNGPVVLVSMLAMFSTWGWVAVVSHRRGRGVVASLGVAAWSAVVTMTLGVCFGVVLEMYLAPVALESMRYWPEFERSGWSDLQAFALANTMESAISHMVAGPVAAVIFGGFALLMSFAVGGRLQRPMAGR